MTQGVDIPVNIVGSAAAVASLHRIEEALNKTGGGASAAEPKLRSFGERVAGIGTAARHVNELAEFMQRLGSAVHGAATRITELSSEQQRLTANSTRLGLNFEQAAQQAGGFVSEVQTMTLATSLADRGIRATQEELNALARVGMSRAAATGKNLEEVFDSLTDSVLEGGEEMGKFGGNLLRVSDGTHTAGERMRAFVTHARTVAPAMRTSADEMARFNREVHNAGRTLSTAFAEEFTRLLSLPNAMRDSSDRARDFNDTLRAIGMTAANIVTVIGGATTAALGFMVAGVGTLVGSVRVLVAGISALPGGARAAQAAMAASGRENFGPDSFVSTIGRFSEAAGRAALSALGGGPSLTSAAPETSPTLASTREQMQRDRRERERRQSPGSAGVTATDAELARIEAGLEIAARMSASEREARFGIDYEEIGGVVVGARDIIARLRSQRIDVLRRQATERRAGESTGDRRRRVAQLNARIDELKRELRDAGESEAATGRSQFTSRQSEARQAYEGVSRGLRERAESSIEKERGEATTRREAEERKQQEAKSRVAQDRSFTQELTELSNQRMSIARQEAETVSHAFRSMGQAVSTHLVAVLQGKEELGTALQAMLSETLSAISQEATVKAGLNLAEGFAALATYRYDAAATHFAAAGIFTAVAAATGVAGAALAPQTQGAASAQPQGGAERRDRSAAPMSAGATSGASGTTVVNVAFNGPQFGTGGVVQAARQLVGVINAGAIQGGVQVNRLAIPAGVR